MRTVRWIEGEAEDISRRHLQRIFFRFLKTQLHFQPSGISVSGGNRLKSFVRNLAPELTVSALEVPVKHSHGSNGRTRDRVPAAAASTGVKSRKVDTGLNEIGRDVPENINAGALQHRRVQKRKLDIDWNNASAQTRGRNAATPPCLPSNSYTYTPCGLQK